MVNVLRKRYGKNLVKKVRKLQKYYFKYRKAIFDLNLLLTCKEKNIMPKFCKIQSNQQPTEIFKYMQHSSEQIIELRDKVIFNFWSLVLTDHEKTLLSKGLNFTILHKDLNYVDYLLPFELSYSDINSLEISN